MHDALSDRLSRILDYKVLEARALLSEASATAWEDRARSAAPPRNFSGALLERAREDQNALICEVKRRSPSAGDINLSRSPAEAARAYEVGGAACISVLTDGPSFGGSNEDLLTVSGAVSVPVLRKDFIVDPIRVLESRSLGADAILIIMAALSDQQALEIHEAADRFGMSVLIEVHDAQELQRAAQLPSPLIGVDNRNLRSFTTDLSVTETLAPLAPPGRLLISESGVRSPDDISRLRRCGARGFLIGESLMRSDRPAEAVSAMLQAR